MKRELVNLISFSVSLIPLAAVCLLMLIWSYGVLD